MGILGSKTASTTTEPAAQPGGLSIIAVGMTVRGDIDTNGTLKVEGAVEGHVKARNQVLVARGGLVQGDIDAREAIVGGSVQGAIRASERVEVQAGATVHGDVTTRRIAVSEGGSLNGQIRMSDIMPDSRPAEKSAKLEPQRPQATPTPVPQPNPAGRPSVPVARVAVPPRLPSGPNQG